MEQITDSIPVISVIMPVYNSRRYLEEAVESILQQSFKDFEFLVFDDGSTDGSQERLQQYAAKDSRIRLFLREHGGHTRLLNEGIRCSRGEFIARMDSDDIAMPNRFKIQVEYLRKNPDCVAVGSDLLIIDPGGWPVGVQLQKTEHELIDQRHLSGRGGAIIHPSAMFRRFALEQIAGYRTELEPAEDLDLFIRLADVGQLANIPQVLIEYRHHFNRTTDKRRDIQLKTVRKIVTRAWMERGLGSPPEHIFDLPRLISPRERREQWIRMAITHNYYLTSYKHLFILVIRHPYSLKIWKLVVKALIKLSLYNVQKLSVLFKMNGNEL